VPNLKDVARFAGVHPTTASSVLNAASGNSRFSEETRHRVETAARQLGYVRNRAARGLRIQRSHSIGLVAGNLLNPFFAFLAQELEKCLQPLGYELVLTSHGADNADDECRLAQTLLERTVDALLIWSEVRNARTGKLPERPNCPLVYLGYAPPGVCAVTINIERGIALAVGHLVKSGCRRLALYSPSYARHAGLPRPRPDIFIDVCRRSGLPRPSLYFYEGESSDMPAAVSGALRILSSESPPDALIGYNDVCAAAWSLAARELCKHCPIVGFDGTPFFRAFPSRYPYVDLRAGTVSKVAVEILQKLLEEKKTRRRSVAVDPEFVCP